MLRNYATFDFGKSFFRDTSVVDLIIEKMPVSISIGLWTTLIIYLVSIPLGIAKAVRDGTRFDSWTSAAVIIGSAIPAFLFAILLIVLFAGGRYLHWFPLRGLISDNWSDLSWPVRILDYFWHMALPLIAMVVGGFASLTMLTKNSFLEQINQQYVMTARAKGLTERRVLYGHVFRNAMLIVIGGFPAAFIGILFAGSLLIEIIFSLDGLGLLGYDALIQPRLSRALRRSLHLRPDRPADESRRRFHLHAGRSAHRFREPGDMTALPDSAAGAAALPRPPHHAADPAPPRPSSAPTGAASGRSGSSSRLFVVSLFAEFIANDRPLLVRFDGHFYVPVLLDYPETTFGGDFETVADYKDPYVAGLIKAKGWMIWPLIPYSYDTAVLDLPGPAPTPPDRHHWLGTDDQARDVLARVIYGFRISVLFGLALSIVCTPIGIARRRRAGLFRRRGRSLLPALPRDLRLDADAFPADDPGQRRHAEFLVAARHHALHQLDLARGPRAGRVPAGAQFRICARGPRARRRQRDHHVPPPAAQRHGLHPDLPALPGGRRRSPLLTSLDFLGFGLPPGSPSLGDLLHQGETNLQAPWLGITGFVVLGTLLILLVFIGEAVRDAFDPRKNLA